LPPTISTQSQPLQSTGKRDHPPISSDEDHLPASSKRRKTRRQIVLSDSENDDLPLGQSGSSLATYMDDQGQHSGELSTSEEISAPTHAQLRATWAAEWSYDPQAPVAPYNPRRASTPPVTDQEKGRQKKTRKAKDGLAIVEDPSLVIILIQ
jgi:hypothetical protein